MSMKEFGGLKIAMPWSRTLLFYYVNFASIIRLLLIDKYIQIVLGGFDFKVEVILLKILLIISISSCLWCWDK
jgi:hypothetical protein